MIQAQVFSQVATGWQGVLRARRRLSWGAWLATLALFPSLLTAAAEEPLSVEARQAGANENWFAAMQEDIARREYGIHQGEEGLSAPNRKHNLRIHFHADGIQVIQRTNQQSEPGVPEPGGIEEPPASTSDGESTPQPNLLGLRYSGLSRDDIRLPAQSSTPYSNGNRVELP